MKNKNKLGVDYKAKFLQSLRYMEILETELVAERLELEELKKFKEFVCMYDKFYLAKFEFWFGESSANEDN